MKKLILSLFVFAALPLQVSAAPVALNAPVTQFAVCASNPAENFFSLQPWHACLPKDPSGKPMLTSINDVFKIVFPLIESLVKIAALVAVAVIFFMIFKMLTARGDTGKIAAAGMGIRDAIIGLIIALISVAIVNFIAGAFQV